MDGRNTFSFHVAYSSTSFKLIIRINTTTIKDWGTFIHFRGHFVHNALSLYNAAYSYTPIRSGPDFSKVIM